MQNNYHQTLKNRFSIGIAYAIYFVTFFGVIVISTIPFRECDSSDLAVLSVVGIWLADYVNYKFHGVPLMPSFLLASKETSISDK